MLPIYQNANLTFSQNVSDSFCNENVSLQTGRILWLKNELFQSWGVILRQFYKIGVLIIQKMRFFKKMQ